MNDSIETGPSAADDAEAPPGEDDALSLYYSPGCVFCHRVLQVIEELGIELTLRNLWEDRDAQRELVGARGRATVPVLRIHRADGSDVWMPESADIVRYLRRSF